MTLNQLKYFCELARTEHYGLAAQNLYISQPSLSNAISNLEEELGTALFEHHGRGIALTRAGRLFYYQLKPILEQLETACSTIRQQNSINEMPRIGCVSPAITSVYEQLMDAYCYAGNTLPHLLLQVDASEVLIDGLRRGNYDLVLCSRIPNAEGVHYLSVASFPFAVIMCENDPLAKQESILPADLNGKPMVFTNAPAFARTVQTILSHYHCVPIISGVANDDSALFGMARAGIAVFLSHDYPQAHCPGIAVRKLEQDFCHRELVLAYTDKSLKRAFVKNIIDFVIKEHFFISG